MFDYTDILNLHEFQIEYSEGRYNIPIIKTENLFLINWLIFVILCEVHNFLVEFISFWMISVLKECGVYLGVIYRD